LRLFRPAIGIEGSVPEEFVDTSMQIVGSGASGSGDHSPRGTAVFSGKVAGQHLELADGFHGRRVAVSSGRIVARFLAVEQDGACAGAASADNGAGPVPADELPITPGAKPIA
jgi:hypothetical protein